VMTRNLHLINRRKRTL